MTPQQIKEYIQSERAKGTPDAKIYDFVSSSIKSSSGEKTERGFAGEILPVGGAILGRLGGAALAGGTTFGIGTGAGAIGGSALGGALGETAQQAIERFTGQREEFSPGQIAASGIISGLTEGTGQAAFKVGGKLLASKPVQMTVKELRPKIVQLVGKLSGYGDDLVQKALERSPGTVKALQEGEQALHDMVRKSASKISVLARESVEAAKVKVNELSKTFSLGGKGKTAGRAITLKEGGNFMSGLTNSLRTSHNIGVESSGQLLFNRANQPSRIVAGGDQKAIQEGFNTVKSILNDTSISHINAVLEKLIVLKTKTPVGSPTGTQTRSVIGEMIERVKDFVKTPYPEYFKFLTDNTPKRVAIEEAKELFGGSANMSPLEVTKISKRLLKLYSDGNLPIRESIEEVGSQVGEDILGTTAGTIMKLDTPVNILPGQVSTRGVIEKLIESVPRVVVDNYAKTGKITGEILSNPIVTKLMQTLKLSAKGVMQFISQLSASKTVD